MQAIIELLQEELERLFAAEEIRSLGIELLGIDPQELEAGAGKGAIAKALVERCASNYSLQALADAILICSGDANERLGDINRIGLEDELAVDTHLGKWRLVKKLDSSGLGAVYLAERDNEEGKTERAALKVMRRRFAFDRAAIARFETTLRAIRSARSPFLAAPLDFGRLPDGRPWAAHAYLEGQSLAEQIARGGSLPFEQAKSIFTDVLEALLVIHERRLVHGNVTAENVLVAPRAAEMGEREQLRAVLKDAGFSRLVIPSAGEAGGGGLLVLFGAAKAMAPERARGVENDPRSDLYALGVLMYEALTGRPPFIGDSAVDVIAQQLRTEPDEPSAHAPRGKITQEINDVILRALAKDPADRFQSAAEFLDALQQIGKPAREQAPLDRAAFEAARAALLRDPGNEALAGAIERQVRHAGAWQEAIEALQTAAEAATAFEAKLSLLFRVARICETEIKDIHRAEEAYQQIIGIDPTNRVAISGIESCRRAGGDLMSLVELLINKVEKERSPLVRVTFLSELAAIYEEKLRDADSAFTAWLQALVENPRDEQLEKQVERLAGAQPKRWSEAVETLGGAAQKVHSNLAMPGAERQAAEARLHTQAALLSEKRQALQAAEQAATYHQKRLAEAEQQFTAASRNVDDLEELAFERKEEASRAYREAESAIKAFKTAEVAEPTLPDRDTAWRQVQQLNREAVSRISASNEAAALSQKTTDDLAQAQQQVQSLQATLAQLHQTADEAARAAGEARIAVQAAEQAERRLLEEIKQIEQEADPTGRRERDLGDLVKMYQLMGRWYIERLNRPDIALPCLMQVLEIDPTNKAALDAIIDLYRASERWNELAAVLLQSADRTASPLRSRDYRAEAATILYKKLNQPEAALEQLQRILKEDATHAIAAPAAEQIMIECGQWSELAAVWEARVDTSYQDQKVELLNRLADLYENRLNAPEQARAKYEAALQISGRDPNALQGLERAYARKNDYRSLLNNLREQAEVAPAPKQRITLLERIGTIYEKEFVNAEKAAEYFKQIIALDPTHEAANVALERLYKQLQRYGDLVDTLDRHSQFIEDKQRKIDMLLQCARILMIEINAPDRAMAVCERALELEPDHPEALDLLTSLKTTAGDTMAALDALERRAEHERNPKKRAELLIRGGKLLEDARDQDTAIERYRQASEVNRQAAGAYEALRRIFSERNDVPAIVDILRKQNDVETSEPKKAELLAELGTVYRERLNDVKEAHGFFLGALKLDPNCIRAAFGLGKIAYEKGDYDEACQYFESVLGRDRDMSSEEASELYLQAGESFQRLGKTERAIDVFRRARDLAPHDLRVNLRLAELFTQSGDLREAERICERIVRKFDEEMSDRERTQALLALGRIQLSAKLTKQAVKTLRSALEEEPNDLQILSALTEAEEELGNWNEVVGLLQLRARLTQDQKESFQLRVHTGDIFLEKLNDRKAAVQTYTAALEMEPHNRNLLTKLMAIYSNTQDWPHLIETVLRVAETVTDKDQLAEYYRTVANIAHRELGRYDEAARYYEEALANQLDLKVAFAGLVECLTQNQDWEKLQNAYYICINRLRETASKAELARLMDARGDVLLQRLGRTDDAVVVYEEAQSFDPDNRDRKQMLNEIYAREPKRFFEQIVKANREILQADPYYIESYRTLRNIYAKVKRYDEAWCVSQVLYFLKMADPEEEKLFRRYRLAGLAKIEQAMTEESWRELVIHPVQDPQLTAILAALQPAVVAAQARELTKFGTDPRYKIDVANDPRAICRVIDHAARSMSSPLPDIYYCPEDAGGLTLLSTAPPAIGMGRAAASSGENNPPQALAFLSARHLSYFRPGHIVRHLVPTGTGLRSWMMAAIRMIAPKFPAPPAAEAQIRSCYGIVEKNLSDPQRDTLRDLTRKMLSSAPELDMKRWINGVDLTADRIGFAVCNDLKIANAVIEASPEEASSLPAKERERELLRYSISDSYFELRRRLGIALRG